jgi:hypothetical protein
MPACAPGLVRSCPHLYPLSSYEEKEEEEVAVDMASMMSYSEVVSEYLTWI